LEFLVDLSNDTSLKEEVLVLLALPDTRR